MIDFYTQETPNGKKVHLMLEELGIPYTKHMVDFAKLEQKSPEFLAMNPNGRIPVIVDHEGPNKKTTTVFESAAILYYLAERHGKFLGHGIDEKSHVMQWVMFQMSGVGPIFGNYFYGLKSLHPFNQAYVDRFEKEAHRLLGVMEIQLARHTYLAGEEYTIADMCMYFWIAKFMTLVPDWFAATPSVRRWAHLIAERPAVKKVPA